ncbi:TPA: hypothetical protein ROW14_004165 [Yersinia enterocolitica]|nr:hypothetical protein [Yersinia enterocolitica]
MYSIDIDEFEHILKEDELPSAEMFLMNSILSEIKEFSTTFIANTDDLVNKASEHSVTYNRLDSEQKLFLNGVMKMPIFICYGPDDESDVDGVVSYPKE